MCVIHTIKCSPYIVSAVAATRDPDGRHLLIASSFDGLIVVISLLNEQRRLTLTGTFHDWCLSRAILRCLGHTKSPRQLIVDSTHHYLYSCSADKKVLVHNFLNGSVVYEYKTFEKAVTSIAMNQQQNLLIASSLDGLIKIFNIQTHELIQQLTTTTSQSIISMIYKNNLVRSSFFSSVSKWMFLSQVYCGMESGTIEILQCDINQVYRCEVSEEKVNLLIEHSFSLVRIMSSTFLASRRCLHPCSTLSRAAFVNRTWRDAFFPLDSSTLLQIQRCLWKQCMKWVPLKKFGDHLRMHTENLHLETKQESLPTTPSTLPCSTESSVTHFSTKTIAL